MENKNLDELWQAIEKQLEKSKKPYAHMKATYEFNIIDKNKTYQIAFQEGEATIFNESKMEPDCTLSMDEENFKKLLLGKLNSTMAFMTGKLKVQGNIQQSLALEKLLKQYDLSRN